MKKKGHPSYQQVLFVDSASGHRFVCGSALQPQGKEKFEGVEYPVSYLSISSTSHPFFTGSKGLVDSEGRVQKFNRRFGLKSEPVRETAPVEEAHAEPAGKPAAAEASKKAPAAKPAAAKAAPAPAKAAAPAKPAAGKAAPAKGAPAAAPAKAPAKPAAKGKK